mmetsp:Transcript_85492/g.275774  ORF Transcript_85492/g.275774 Transcript_85492/m.275774 type:complete len:291 (-) Transcript_85492:4366-5238(-)
MELAHHFRQAHFLLDQGQLHADARALPVAERQPRVRRTLPGVLGAPAIGVKLEGLRVDLRIVVQTPRGDDQHCSRRDLVRSQRRRAINGAHLLGSSCRAVHSQALLHNLGAIGHFAERIPSDRAISDDGHDLLVHLLLHLRVLRQPVQQHRDGRRGAVVARDQEGRHLGHDILVGQHLPSYRVGHGEHPLGHVLHRALTGLASHRALFCSFDAALFVGDDLGEVFLEVRLDLMHASQVTRGDSGRGLRRFERVRLQPDCDHAELIQQLDEVVGLVHRIELHAEADAADDL